MSKNTHENDEIQKIIYTRLTSGNKNNFSHF